MKLRAVYLTFVMLAVAVSAQDVTIGRYSTQQDVAKAFVANLRAIPNTKFTLRSSDKAGGTIQAVRLVRNQELGSLFVLITEQEPGTALIEATFTRNGGWFGGGDPKDWASEYSRELKVLLPDLAEIAVKATEESSLERVVDLPFDTPAVLDIKHGDVTVESIAITSWPSIETGGGERKADADAKAVVTLKYSNTGEEDWTCTYSIAVLDASGQEIGTGKRVVDLEEGNNGKTHRVGLMMRLGDVPKASKLLVRVVPKR